MTIQEALQWVLVGGGAGWLAYAIIGWIPALENLKDDLKRYASFAMTAILACAGFGLEVVFGFEIAPISVQGWIEALFAVIAVAITVSQTIHAARVLAKR